MITSALVFNPAVSMPAPWIMMGPVYDTTPVVPFILAIEFNCVANVKVFDPRGQIDVVCYQHGLGCRCADDETLMPTALCIDRQYFAH